MSKASANHRRSFLILQRSIHPQVPMLRLPIFHAVEYFKQKSFVYSIKWVSDGLWFVSLLYGSDYGSAAVARRQLRPANLPSVW